MFEIGFQELFLLGVIALLVVGPERLPALARTVGLWVGKAQRLVSQVRADVERELHAEELRRTMREDAGVDAIAEVRKEMEDLAGGFSQPAFESPPPEAAKEAPPKTPAEVEAAPESEPESEPELALELELEPPEEAAPEPEPESKMPAAAAAGGGAGGANGADGGADRADGTASSSSSAPPAGDRDDRAAAS